MCVIKCICGLHVNVYEKMLCPNCGTTLTPKEAAPSASNNSDYATALYKWRDEHIDKLSISAWGVFNRIVERLNVEIPHCA